jgi:hypothetical protein
MPFLKEVSRDDTNFCYQGFCSSLIFNYIGVNAKTMSLQYLETLKSLGAGASTKFIFPMEFTNLLKPFIEHANEAMKKE